MSDRSGPRPSKGIPATLGLPGTGRIWPVMPILLVAIASIPTFLLPVNYDVSWLLYMAGRVLDGVEPYRGVVEPNPPLIVWLNLPIHLAADTLSVPADVMVKIAAIIMIVASVVAARRWLALADPGRDMFAVALAFVLASAVDHHVFQREHIFLALVVPYLCLAAVRLAGARIPLPWALMIGVGGAVGFLLKPFYVPIWLLVEAVLALRMGWRRAVRAESLAVLFAGFAYVAAILVWAPAYPRVARWGATLYRSYGPPISLAEILLDPRALAAAIVVAFAILMRRRYPVGPLRLVLLTALVGYIGAVALQGKSFINHWYPAEGLLLLAGYQTLAEVVRAKPRGRLALPWPWMAAIALILVTGANAWSTLARWSDAYQKDPFYLDQMSHFLRTEAGAGSLFNIGGTMRASFPLVHVAGVEYESRFHSLWLLAGSYEQDCSEPCRPFEYHSIEAMGPAERYQFDAVVDDLERARSDVLIVDLLPPNGMSGFDYVEYFSQSSRFKRVLASYEYVTTVAGRYRAYRRIGLTSVGERSRRAREKVAK